MTSCIFEANLTGRVEDLQYFFTDFENWCQERSTSPRQIHAFVLMLDEWLTNVAMHAYQGQGGIVKVKAHNFSGQVLEVEISDRGVAYDPTNQPQVDVSASLENREIGGLGVHFIRQLADAFTYQRDGEWNVVTIRRQLGA